MFAGKRSNLPSNWMACDLRPTSNSFTEPVSPRGGWRGAEDVLRLFRRQGDRPLAKQIRRITEGLGDARDKDVQIEFLCGVLSAVTDKTCFPGISQLLVQLEHEREQLQPIVVKATDRLVASKVLDEMQSATKGLVAEAKSLEPGDYSEFVRAQLGRHILCRLEAMLPYEDSLKDPEDRQRHHAMRIAAKRLRYTVEIAKPVYVPALDDVITAVKKVQTLLGDVHDCDVWLAHWTPTRRRSVAGWWRCSETPTGSPAWKPASITSARSAAAVANRSSRNWSTTGGSCGGKGFGRTSRGLCNQPGVALKASRRLRLRLRPFPSRRRRLGARTAMRQRPSQSSFRSRCFCRLSKRRNRRASRKCRR